MATVAECMVTDTTWQQATVAELQRRRVFPDVPEEELLCLVSVAREERTPPGVVLVDQSAMEEDFVLLLEGRVRVSRMDPNGQYFFNKVIDAPSFMGEQALLTGMPSHRTVKTETDVLGLRISGECFWQGMAQCPHLRQAILSEMQMRIRGMQVHQSQMDKLAALGTMTAGLMHELNNPGAAARRAASQLRSNLQRMHELARGFSERGHTTEQRACLSALQDRVLAIRKDMCLSSLQQSDAEELLGSWMDEHHLQRAWEFAPVLVSSGIAADDLQCLAHVFGAGDLNEPVEWLEATASSMQMVGLVEESVTRVTELAQAVKNYAHEGQGGVQDVDINESVHATLVMLKHKLREKGIRLQKNFGASLPRLHCVCTGLNQVWTNLLDNAIDAVGSGGAIVIRTKFADGELQIVIEDNGPGIAPADQERIFDPFYTTKEAGVGSGLGLGIVRRILENYNGRLTLESQPGRTEFTVHIPTQS